MDYYSLKYVITVDKHQSISKAAEELYLSQPNISKAIQNLEKETGIKIFTRTSKGVITTTQGKEFIKKASELVYKFETFSNEFSSSNPYIFTMSVAHPKDIYYQNKVIDITPELKHEKDININVFEGSTEEIIDMVIKNDVHLGIICINEYELAYYKKLLMLNKLDYSCKKPQNLKLLFNLKNPLAKQEFVDESSLAKQTLITTNTNDYYNYYNERYHLFAGSKVLKVYSGLNQLAILSKTSNSYMLSLPLSNETVKQFDCKMVDFSAGTNSWITIFIYKNSTIFTELEKKLMEKF